MTHTSVKSNKKIMVNSLVDNMANTPTANVQIIPPNLIQHLKDRKEHDSIQQNPQIPSFSMFPDV